MNSYETVTQRELKTALSLINALIDDANQVFPSSNFERDKAYMLERSTHEGTSFFLSTLPLLGGALDRSLVTEAPLQVPCNFALYGKSRLPRLLHSLFKQVFDEEGNLICRMSDLPNKELIYDHVWPRGRRLIHQSWLPPAEGNLAALAVKYLRQILSIWKKVEVPLEKFDEDTILDEFIIRITSKKDLNYVPNNVAREARRLLRLVFQTSTPFLTQLHQFRKEPWGRHGPGAVAGRERGSGKWSEFTVWPGVSPKLFSWRDGAPLRIKYSKDAHPARIALVPKDYRGPRVICVEPKENQFAQQGLMELLYGHLQTCELTRRSINFVDVSPSREICYTYKYSTIDLKDASDHLSLDVAKLLLPKWFFALVTRYRTREIITGLKSLPKVKPRSLATMGNALCFPLETLLFWAITQAQANLYWKECRRNGKRLPSRAVRVFGDDIIVDTRVAPFLVTTLATFGLQVNQVKTCINSHVRESCGEWVYWGLSCKTINPKAMSVSTDRSWIQFLDYFKELDGEWFLNTRQTMRELILEFKPKASVRKRWNRFLQRYELSVPSIIVEGEHCQPSEYAGLYAWHVRNNTMPLLGGGRLKVKKRWVESQNVPIYGTWGE